MFVRHPPRPVRVALIGLAVAGVLAGCGGAESRYASHLDRGKQFLAQGNLDKANVEFRNALQIQPKSAEPLYLSGQVAERHNNIRLALSLYLGAVEYNPDYPHAEAALGRVYAIYGAPDKALAAVEPALVKHPNDPELL